MCLCSNISEATIYSKVVDDKLYSLNSDIKSKKSEITCPTNYTYTIPTTSSVMNAFKKLVEDSNKVTWLPITLNQPSASGIEYLRPSLRWDTLNSLVDTSFINWSSGEPNNGGGLDRYFNSIEECVVMYTNGKWNDDKCSENFNFVCDKLLFCNGTKWPDPDICFGNGQCTETDYCSCYEGYYCSLENGVNGTCPNGKYSNFGAQSIDECFDCTFDQVCINGTRTNCSATHYYFDELYNSECRVCPEGFYVKLNDTNFKSCEICPPGYYCPGDSTKSKCQGDSYASEYGQESCTDCPEGFYITDDRLLCLPCNRNEVCKGNGKKVKCSGIVDENNECLECPSGSFCEEGISIECYKGLYIDTIANICLPCPYGKSCSFSSSLNLCTNNKYAPEPGMEYCLTCQPRRYTDNKGIYCYPCDSGSACDGIYMTPCRDNQYLDENSCDDCTPGYYCSEYKKYSCPSGMYQDEANQTSCKECPAGTYNLLEYSESSDSCTPCPNNTYSNNASSTCIACPEGTYSYGEGDINTCYPCPKGKYITRSSNSLECMNCIGGFSSDEGSSTCFSCPAGTYSLEGDLCEICPAGTYSMGGKSYCELCPPGTYNEFIGKTSLNDCIYCEKGGSPIYGATNDSVCNTCSPGTFKVDTSCLPCPEGEYSEYFDSISCKKCPIGTYINYTNAISVEECLFCPKGSYSPFEGASNCINCTAGTYKDKIGSTTPCEICPSGYYSPEHSETCYECNLGEYSLEESSICSICPSGSFSNSTASIDCYLCEQGMYQELDGQTKCNMCPKGTYNSNIGSNNSTMCIKCPIGTYSPSNAASDEKYCLSCPSGTFCDEEGLSKPRNCPKGTFSTIVGSISVTSCQPCPAGTYSESEGASSELFCNSCPISHYSSEIGAVSLSSCKPCPLGTYSSILNAKSLNDCTLCNPGTYSDIIGKPCILCPIGTYNSLYGSSNIDQCLKCQPPSISKEGSTKESDCYSCDPGFYLTLSFECEQCPIGTYFNTSKLNTTEYPKYSDCLSCGLGYIQPNKGKYLKSDCISCKAGTYAPLERNFECTPCGAGYYSTIEASGSFDNCESCPQGYWSTNIDANSFETCIPCVPGTYGNQSHSPSISYCNICPAFTKSTQMAQTNCTNCTENYCSYPGSTYDITPNIINDDVLSFYDPQSSISHILSGYITMKLAIPSGLVALLIIFIVIVIVIILIIFRKYVVMLLKNLDWAFSVQKKPPLGKPSIKNPSVAGGLTSMIVIAIFLSLLASILLDFIGNNKVVLESTVLELSVNTRGNFLFDFIVIGVQEMCNATSEFSGFNLGATNWMCTNGTHNFNGTIVQGCQCSWSCLDCLPYGNTQTIRMKFDGYILTPVLLFSVGVPHFVENEIYYTRGSLLDTDSLFTGNKSEHQLSFKLKPARYVSVSSLNSIYEVVGYSPVESIRQGYTLDITSKVPGSSKPYSNFSVEKGLNVFFQLEPMQGINISQEYVKQNLFMFSAQIFTLVSVSIVFGEIILRLIKFIEWVINKLRRKFQEKKTYVVPFDSELWEDEQNFKLKNL